MKKCLITGVSGQDGAYLARFLLNRGYFVIGSYRRTSSNHFWRLEALNCFEHPNLKLIELDLTDFSSVIMVLRQYDLDEVYNLAAQSFVGASFDQPLTTGCITGMGAHNVLEAIRLVNPKIRFYQASTSEMFGKAQTAPQDETTPFHPRSPYGVSKLYAHWMTINYREHYGMFATSGILFNHESPLRGLEFVTRKITDSVAKIELGKLDCLELGNLDSTRDWGFAEDYVEGMWKMLQVEKPDVFVLSTGRTETVRNFARMAFEAVDREIKFFETGASEYAIDRHTGKVVLKVNPKFFRPTESELLVGNSSKAKELLNWENKTSLENLVHKMVRADLDRNQDYLEISTALHTEKPLH